MQRYHEKDGPTGQHLHFQSSNGAKTENADIYMAPFAIRHHLRGPNVVFWHVTFSSLEAKPLGKLTFDQNDKILLSSWRP